MKRIKNAVLAIGLAGSHLFTMPAAHAQSRPSPSNQWYNCLTREVWSPEKTAWCQRIDRLNNSTYVLPDIGSITLTDGRYENPSSQVRATLLRQYGAIGDLNQDGQADLATLLTVSTGGSGVFTYLIAGLVPPSATDSLLITNPILLGDRVQVQSMAIDNGKVSVTMLTQGPNDPMCCPTEKVTRTFSVDYQLTQHSTEQTRNPNSLTSADSGRSGYQPIDLSQLNAAALSGTDPKAIALAAFGAQEPMEGNFQQAISSTSQGNRAVVMLSQVGFPDDSVRGMRYRVELEQQPGSTQPQWRIVWAGRQQLCQPDRGPQDWTTGSCQ